MKKWSACDNLHDVQKAADNHAASCQTQTSSVVGDNTNNGRAYLTTINYLGALQHETIATTFVTQMALDLQQIFPGLSDADAKNLA